MREKQASLANEDLSDMVAEHAAKQSNKRKRQAGKEKEGGGANKKIQRLQALTFFCVIICSIGRQYV